MLLRSYDYFFNCNLCCHFLVARKTRGKIYQIISFLNLISSGARRMYLEVQFEEHISTEDKNGRCCCNIR